MNHYIVEVGDCAGTFCERDCGSSFDLCVATVRELTEKYRGQRKVVIVYNADRCDVDSNGLTDDERDQIAEAS